MEPDRPRSSQGPIAVSDIQPPRDEADLVPPAPTAVGKAAAFTASMTQWAVGGFKTVEKDRHDARVAVCSGCKYHQPPLCTVCGCFTDKKAWLPHEDCPLGKWPG